MDKKRGTKKAKAPQAADVVSTPDITKLADGTVHSEGKGGVVAVGKNGKATVKAYGAAIASTGGRAEAGQWGVAFAGCGEDPTLQAGMKSEAVGGANTAAVAGKFGYANCSHGDGAVAVALESGRAAVNVGGVAVSKAKGVARGANKSIAVSLASQTSGQAIAGDGGIAIAVDGGIAAAGQGGIVILVRHPRSKKAKPKLRIGVVGNMEDVDVDIVYGIDANEPYETNRKGMVVRSRKKIATEGDAPPAPKKKTRKRTRKPKKNNKPNKSNKPKKVKK